jgi:hypothetical protein
MPESVAAVIALGPEPDAVYVLNDPFSGSHLPDITLVSRSRATADSRLRLHAGPPL